MKYSITLIALIPAYLSASFLVQLLIIFLVPKIVDALLENRIKSRFEEFDKDYPVMLLQLVSFLKSGMIAMTAFREAAKSLDDSSLVKREVGILNERLKLGLSEEQAINAFGEDIAHPEIELFVQSFLLHSRVGGNLSSTLERLAIQVRKRQQFRSEAHSAIASERISIYAIAAIMIALLIYIHMSSPVLISACFKNPTGQLIFQGGVCLIILGFYWSSRITNIDM
jgi:Flp pilus assembly protein TadB